MRKSLLLGEVRVIEFTKEDAERVQFEFKDFMKKILDIGQLSFSNNKQYLAYRKLVFNEYHSHDERICSLLGLSVNKDIDNGK